ncbi:transketolase [Salsuginibacillus halophilus]|uniref:Transketolase n=1 Tax=Salsuginibacillus halophilus TaxID=517424 RepID=A0A2P8HYK4_9BACI|nr:transketolase [Salsuginibacillus halophilus]PSL51306.1 transketolase [Salsuginibacillus halophilus]
MATEVEQRAINTIRTLSIDAIEKAESGHPGLPMGAAPMALTLWSRFMKHNPSNPSWFNRDRFVLSAGHGSMLLYSLLHLFEYDLSIEELKNFRQLGSQTPGHPEYGHTPGVEATTGPLGQGLAMAVGMAMAERHMAATYNTDKHNVIDHYTYALCGDGDLMEGVSQESASLAGHLQLSRLIVLYDSNDISLDGDLNKSFSEDVLKRYEAYGWHTLYVEDGNDTEAVAEAIEKAQQDGRPSFIEVKTTIGFGSPNKAGTKDAHGAPLGGDEAAEAKAAYGWSHEEPFYVPDDVRAYFKELKEKGAATENAWNDAFHSYETDHPENAASLKRAIKGELPDGFEQALPSFKAGEDKVATRAASGKTIQALATEVPELFGGAADLASSNKTMMDNETDFSAATYEGRNVWFGVREFAMAAAVNGMALHGGVRPYGATFLVFSDYLRPAVRLSALMGIPATFVFTHDSIAVGEDGPTHEPIEQTASLRAIPNLNVIRPADGNETAAAWRTALENDDQPTALVLTRQGVPTLEKTETEAYEGVKRGAYTVAGEKNEQPDLILIATGSEVSLAVDAVAELANEGIQARAVSMPSAHNFELQDAAYKASVLPSNVTARLAVEAGSPQGWDRYTGWDGDILAINGYGASAPGGHLMKEYGFTVENVVERAKALLSK